MEIPVSLFVGRQFQRRLEMEFTLMNSAGFLFQYVPDIGNDFIELALRKPQVG